MHHHAARRKPVGKGSKPTSKYSIERVFGGGDTTSLGKGPLMIGAEKKCWNQGRPVGSLCPEDEYEESCNREVLSVHRLRLAQHISQVCKGVVGRRSFGDIHGCATTRLFQKRVALLKVFKQILQTWLL